MKYQSLSLLEFILTIVIVVAAVGGCYHYLGSQLTNMLETSFNLVNPPR